MFRIAVLLAVAALIPATPAYAYVGPGSSLGAIGVFLGLVATVILTLISFVWYPFKRLARRSGRKGRTDGNNAE